MKDNKQLKDKTTRKHIDVRNVKVWRDKDKDTKRTSTSGCRIY